MKELKIGERAEMFGIMVKAVQSHTKSCRGCLLDCPSGEKHCSKVKCKAAEREDKLPIILKPV